MVTSATVLTATRFFKRKAHSPEYGYDSWTGCSPSWSRITRTFTSRPLRTVIPWSLRSWQHRTVMSLYSTRLGGASAISIHLEIQAVNAIRWFKDSLASGLDWLIVYGCTITHVARPVWSLIWTLMLFVKMRNFLRIWVLNATMYREIWAVCGRPVLRAWGNI